MSARTVRFSRDTANVFFHILTQCNLHCRHCYINPREHGTQRLSLETMTAWLTTMARRAPGANLVFLGGEPTLHPDLAAAVHAAAKLAYGSITIDTNGYLFHDILDHITPEQVNYISFSLDGAGPETNDPIRGQGCFAACTAGIRHAKAKGFRTSLIYTVSQMNLDDLQRMPLLLDELGIDRFFIQVIGLRGQSAAEPEDKAQQLQVSRKQWLEKVIPVAHRVARDSGIVVSYPKVFLEPDAPFECAGRVADNYFIFPNGRVYRCPLCEDYPLHSLQWVGDRLEATAPINEADLFSLDIAEGCVMNKLIQPHNLAYTPEGKPDYQIACCLLKATLGEEG